ncbi:MAG: hypothetical protein JSS09_08865 [Verrucomicrobia bacterium]|nr:hypothetical protein [Verrucomicrobiota bacterium]
MFVNNNKDVSLSTHLHGEKPAQASKIDTMRKHIFPGIAEKGLGSRKLKQILENDPLARS